MPRQYKRLNKIKINEISAVDIPAQGHAKISLLKRDDSAANSGGVESVKKGDSLMADENKVADLEKRLNELQKKLDEVGSERDDAIAKAALSDAEKLYLDGLSEEDKRRFMSLDSSGRKRMMSKRSEEEIEIEKRQKENDELRKRIDELEEATKFAELKKRADESLSSLSGDLDIRAKLLKAAEDIGDDAVAILKSADEAAKSLLVTKGTSQADDSEESANAKLEKMAKQRMQETGEKYLDAYDNVGRERPDLLSQAIREGK